MNNDVEIDKKAFEYGVTNCKRCKHALPEKLYSCVQCSIFEAKPMGADTGKCPHFESNDIADTEARVEKAKKQKQEEEIKEVEAYIKEQKRKRIERNGEEYRKKFLDLGIADCYYCDNYNNFARKGFCARILYGNIEQGKCPCFFPEHANNTSYLDDILRRKKQEVEERKQKIRERRDKLRAKARRRRAFARVIAQELKKILNK